MFAKGEVIERVEITSQKIIANITTAAPQLSLLDGENKNDVIIIY